MNMENSTERGISNGRLVIDEEQKSTLTSFFSNKEMDSTSREKIRLIQECAEATNLTTSQVEVSHKQRVNITNKGSITSADLRH